MDTTISCHGIGALITLHTTACTVTQHIRRLRDVIGHLTIWQPICHFLLVVLWNQASISNGFRDIQHRI